MANKKKVSAVKKSTIYGIPDKKIADNFYLSEFINSNTANANRIKNLPSANQLELIEWVAKEVAQPIRNAVGATLTITSGFRNKRTNSLAGGVSDSYHSYDQDQFAFDCIAPSKSLIDLMKIIQDLNLPITKAILEIDQGIVHVQGIRTQFLARDVISGKKVYNIFDQFLKSGTVKA